MTLQASHVQCSIGKKIIVDDVNLAITPGRMTAIVGPNGVGKTTLLRALAGIRMPSKGEVILDDVPLLSLSSRARAKRLAFVGQEEAPSPDLLLGEMVSLGRTPHRPPWKTGQRSERRIIVDALEAVGLADYINRRCDHLSGGERRRAVIARGLAQQADILLLDEPTNHLDIRQQLQLLEMLKTSRRTVVASIHDLSLAIQFFDEIIILRAGRVIAQSPPNKLACSVIEESFGVRAEIVADSSGSPHLICHSAVM